ncbi:MAG TPA: hypothetical protein VD994_07860, partial [Prosthecobacter sp.]|nr:hypothetical protein [Prosthecobacter sp.]
SKISFLTPPTQQQQTQTQQTMLIESNQKTYPPHPDGLFEAAVVDVIDEGYRDKEFGGEKKRVREARLVFETAEKRDDGKPFLLSAWATASLHEKATLRKLIEPIIGRAITAQEAKSFDLNSIKGKPCQVLVEHKLDTKGNTKAAIAKTLKTKAPYTASGTYVRKAKGEQNPDWNVNQ